MPHSEESQLSIYPDSIKELRALCLKHYDITKSYRGTKLKMKRRLEVMLKTICVKANNSVSPKKLQLGSSTNKIFHQPKHFEILVSFNNQDFFKVLFIL